MTKLQKGLVVSVAIVGAIAAGLAVQLAHAKAEISNKDQLLSDYSSRIEAFQRIDDRRYVAEHAKMVDYQVWAEVQPRFIERQDGKVCEVLRLGAGQYKVTKFIPGDAQMVFAEFSFGGPKACDRVQY